MNEINAKESIKAWCCKCNTVVNVYNKFDDLEHYLPSTEFGQFDELIENVCYGPFQFLLGKDIL